MKTELRQELVQTQVTHVGQVNGLSAASSIRTVQSLLHTSDKNLQLLLRHPIGQLTDHPHPLLRHQLLQVLLQEESVIVAGVSGVVVCLQTNLCSPGIVVPWLRGLMMICLVMILRMMVRCLVMILMMMIRCLVMILRMMMRCLVMILRMILRNMIQTLRWTVAVQHLMKRCDGSEVGVLMIMKRMLWLLRFLLFMS